MVRLRLAACAAATACLAAGGLATGGPAAAQPGSAPPATGGAEPTPQSVVTVTAPPIKDVPQLVQKFGRPAGGGRLARWDAEVCPSVRGDLPVAFRRFIVDRINQTAVSVGGLAARPHCRVNIAILVVPDAQAVTEKIARYHRAKLQESTRWPIDKFKLAAWVADDHPVRVWHVSHTVQTNGGLADETDVASLSAAFDEGNGPFGGLLGPEQFGNVLPSRLTPSGDEAFQREVVIVDRDRIGGLTAGQVSAYLAMVTLAQVRPDADLGGVDTIMNLFADQKGGRPAPPDLTFWDRAYLQGLYKTNGQVDRGMQDSAMSDHIRHEIVAHNVLPLSQTQTQPQTEAPAPAAPPPSP